MFRRRPRISLPTPMTRGMVAWDLACQSPGDRDKGGTRRYDAGSGPRRGLLRVALAAQAFETGVDDEIETVIDIDRIMNDFWPGFEPAWLWREEIERALKR